MNAGKALGNTKFTMNRNTKDYLALVLKGIAMGAADVIPGVSGGTIAFITGIYEELINSIKSINLKAIKLLFSLKIAEFWKTINGTFLLSVLLGIGISVFSLAKGLKFLLDHYPILVWAFFFGLIVASAIYVARTIKEWSSATIISGISGIIIAYFITIISPAEANTTYWFIFISGAIAICAMILPGISGSFILVLLGMYKFILEAVGNLQIAVILTFLAGAAIGIIAFSNVLSWLLKKYHNQTIALLSGFMVGSLNKVWPWKQVTETFIDRHGEIKPLVEENILPATYEQITGNEAFLLWAVLLAVVGFALIFVIEGLTKPGKVYRMKDKL
jgi:putative membrane protein